MSCPSIRRMVLQLLVPLGGAILVIGACTESPDNIAINPTPALQADCSVQCFCCGDSTDPNPTAPGIWEQAITPSFCFTSQGATGVDADGDGLVDYCEEIIAPAFAPELYYYNQDDVRGEPHWAARPNGNNTVFIAYALSYYYDLGGTQFYYPCNLPGAPDTCRGHNGDSEDIYLIVYYNSTTQHWVLGRAYYSQHGNYGNYDQGSGAYPSQLYYPSHPGAYPRAYVSEGKHANYSNVSECNNGGTLWSDTCNEDNAAARVAMYGPGGSLNLGSSAHPFMDCVPSTNTAFEYYGSGRLECYWTVQSPNERFRGWIPTSIGGDDADPYSPKLIATFAF